MYKQYKKLGVGVSGVGGVRCQTWNIPVWQRWFYLVFRVGIVNCLPGGAVMVSSW
jgi:hypothetical protein